MSSSENNLPINSNRSHAGHQQQPERGMKNLHHYLLTKGKVGGQKSGRMGVPSPGLKTRNTNVNISPPSTRSSGKAGEGSTPAHVKRKQVMKGLKCLSSPTDILSPCSQKLWRRPAGVDAIPPIVPKLNLLAADEQDEGELTVPALTKPAVCLVRGKSPAKKVALPCSPLDTIDEWMDID